MRGAPLSPQHSTVAPAPKRNVPVAQLVERVSYDDAGGPCCVPCACVPVGSEFITLGACEHGTWGSASAAADQDRSKHNVAGSRPARSTFLFCGRKGERGEEDHNCTARPAFPCPLSNTRHISRRRHRLQSCAHNTQHRGAHSTHKRNIKKHAFQHTLCQNTHTHTHNQFNVPLHVAAPQLHGIGSPSSANW